MTSQGPVCASCRQFRNQPAYLEQALPGLTSMSSAYADVRNTDGLCLTHDVLLRATASCAQHEAVT